MKGPVVVLGHTGFVGRRVCEFLRAAGVDIHGFASATVDLRHPESLRKLDGQIGPDTTLIVTAALTPDKGATLGILQANLDIVMNTARYLEAHPVRLCVYTSSDAVYPPRYALIDEGTPVEPANFNALAKYTGERVLARVSELTNLPLLVLRLTPMYGFGDTHGAYGPNLFVRRLLEQAPVQLFGEGEEQRDHLYIDDAARLIVELAEQGRTGTYNLATGRSHSFAEVVESLRRIVPTPFTVMSAPRKMPVTHRHFDITRLLEAVPGYRFTPLEEGLRRHWAAANGARG